MILQIPRLKPRRQTCVGALHKWCRQNIITQTCKTFILVPDVRMLKFSCGKTRAPLIESKFARTVLTAIAFLMSCKNRQYNETQSSSSSDNFRQFKSIDGQAEALMPLWAVPQTESDVKILPSVSNLGINSATWKKFLSEAFSEKNPTGEVTSLTLSNPECTLSPDSWRLSAARLSLYEIDLPGNVMTWRTVAAQLDADVAQRVQLHITVQPWCSSERVGRRDFVHTLDHAFLLTFDLSVPYLQQQKTHWIEELNRNALGADSLPSDGFSRAKTTIIRPDNTLIPYTSSMLNLQNSPQGRKAISQVWHRALETQTMIETKRLPSPAWQTLKQSLFNSTGLSITSTGSLPLAHPKLKAEPTALNSFFARFVSEKNLLRVRAHVTEGLGTSQRFLRWERASGQFRRLPMQTTSTLWNRARSEISFTTLLTKPQDVIFVGQEQPSNLETRAQINDVDLDATLLAGDISLQHLLSLREKVVDSERTSVHSTRCVSCHGLDDALRMTREGRPTSQRGLTPASLSLFGTNADGVPVVNLRTIKAAEADAARFAEEIQNDKFDTQH